LTYKIEKLAPGAYDVVLEDQCVASLVRHGDTSRKWTVELLADLPAGERPSPFTRPEHRFDSLEEACAWLGAKAEIGTAKGESIAAGE
jgi:hypothetical protein